MDSRTAAMVRMNGRVHATQRKEGRIHWIAILVRNKCYRLVPRWVKSLDTTEVTDALTESNSDTTAAPSNDETITEDGEQTSTHLDAQIEKSDALSTTSSDNEPSSFYTNSFTTAMSASSISSSAINTITPSSSFSWFAFSSPPTLFPPLFPFLSSTPPPSTSAYQPLDLSDLLTSTAHPPVPNSFSSSPFQSASTNNPFWLPLPSNPSSSQSSISYTLNSPSESPHSPSAAQKPPPNVVKAVKTVTINLSNLKPVSYYKGVPIKPDNIWILSFLKKDKDDSQWLLRSFCLSKTSSF